MNKKDNRRYSDTEQRIDRVFMELLEKKELKEITVSEICRRADIHRTTFYGHYTDVYDLMYKMLGRTYEKLMEGFIQEEHFSLKQGFLEAFRLVEKNKTFFRYYLEHKSFAGIDFIRVPHHLREKEDALVREMGYGDREELLYHQEFFNGGLQALLRRWIQRDCKESPEEMYSLLEKEYSLRRDSV